MAVAGGVVAVRRPSVRVRVSLAIADAFMCLCFATLWLFFAAFATMVFWRRTCGEECTEFQVWKLTAFLLAWCSVNTVLLYMLPWIRSDSSTEVPPQKGISTGGIGSAILDGGALAIEFLYCFIVIPTLALRTRKMSRIRHGLDEEKVL